MNYEAHKWPETEIKGICWNFPGKIREITSSELIFWRVLVVWNHSASFDGIYSRKVLSEQWRESAGAQRLHSNQFWRIFPPCLHSFFMEDRMYSFLKQCFARSSSDTIWWSWRCHQIEDRAKHCFKNECVQYFLPFFKLIKLKQACLSF